MTDDVRRRPDGTYLPGQRPVNAVPFPPGKSACPEKQWKPGQSGNPTGQHIRTHDVAAMLSPHTETAVKQLVSIIKHAKKRSDRISAIKLLLDRVVGPVVQQHEGKLTVERPLADVPTEEIRAMVTALAQQARPS